MRYKIEIHGRGSEFAIYELTDKQKQSLIDGDVEVDGLSDEEVCEILEISELFEEETEIGVYPDNVSIFVYDEDEKIVWNSEKKHIFKNTEKINSHSDSDYLLIDVYQKGHFFTYHLEADNFDSNLLSLVETNYIGKFPVITDLKYNQQPLERDFDDYWLDSKITTYYLSE